jgi:hypothetical protein
VIAHSDDLRQQVPRDGLEKVCLRPSKQRMAMALDMVPEICVVRSAGNPIACPDLAGSDDVKCAADGFDAAGLPLGISCTSVPPQETPKGNQQPRGSSAGGKALSLLAPVERLSFTCLRLHRTASCCRESMLCIHV